MEDPDRDFWHAVRSFLLRYAEYNRERGLPQQQLDEFEQVHARLLAGSELREAVVSRLAGLELKCDYHNLIMLTLLQDLAKWSQEHYALLRSHPAPLDCILANSLTLLAAQQQFHTIVPKQNELIATLLPHPHTLQNLEQFKALYRRLKDVKEFYPSATRDHQKQCFLRAVEESIDRAAQSQNLKVVEFVFSNIFNELETLEETHEFVSQRLRIVRKIAKGLWLYHEDILHRIAFLLMRISYQILANRHLFNYVLPIYEALIVRLLQRPSMVPLLLYRHVVFNNVERLLAQGGSCILLEALLGQLSHLFSGPALAYFMRHYDWNFLELPICHQSLNLLHEYTENRAHEGRPHYELVKTYILRIHAVIKGELQGLRETREEEGRWKFYQLKRREFHELLEELNDKPKKVFKRIEAISNSDLREAAVTRYVRLIKKTAHLNNRSMIDIFSTDHPVSAELFAQYVGVVLRQCREHDLEEFMRLFTSNFFLTGESQQIARVMDTITQLYFKHQAEDDRLLRSSDATYTFANAILILNTDLHNPKNEEKISEQSFLKMCRKINDNEDVPLEVLRRTYANIKRNKINTFRDRGNMLGISLSNWLNLCADYESLPLAYYDPELALLDDTSLRCFINDALSSIIDEKETAKLEALVERFLYDDRVFECEIIETLRRIVEKKPHLPLHILQKAMELGNFRHQGKPTERTGKVSEKTLSYYWLSAQLVATFPALLPTETICELLVRTWEVREELQDNLHLRQLAELRRVKQCARWVAKREAKKSIMDMFSSFLSFKESDDEPDPPPAALARRGSFKALSNTLFDTLKYSEAHRVAAVEFLLAYIHGEESRQYEQFVSCLFLIFNLLYFLDHCERVGEDLFYELLGAKESSITKRLGNLARKDSKLYNLLINYCRFWILKLLLKEYAPSKLVQRQNNNYEYMLTKALECLEKVDREILADLLKEVANKPAIHPALYQVFDKAIKKVYSNGSAHDVQFFYDKFNPDKLSEQPLKEEPKEVKEANEVNEVKETNEDLKEQPKQNVAISEQNANIDEPSKPQISKEQDTVKHEVFLSVPLAEKEAIVKQRSVNELEQYVNPDEEINKVEDQIDSNLKAQQALKHEVVKKQPQPAVSENTSPIKPEEVPEGEESPEGRQEEAPSIPVVMF